MGKPSDHSTTDRYRSQARLHASARTTSYTGSITGAGQQPSVAAKPFPHNEAGGLDKEDGRGPAPGLARNAPYDGGPDSHPASPNGDVDVEKSRGAGVEDAISPAAPPPAPPPVKSEAAGAGDPAVKSDEPAKKPKQPMTVARMKAGCGRFGVHLKNALLHSWINVLLLAVPAGIAAEAAGLNASAVFAINAVAIVPLAGLLSHATESVASRLGDTLGALLNVSFGNAVELIIFIIALVKNEIAIVQASLLGSILANLLLILGMAFLFGGLRFREQVYNNTVTQMSACLLSLSVTSLLLPTAFHASFNDNSTALADKQVLKVSRGVSVVLLLVYVLYLLFQLKSHAFMYESTPQAIIDEESHPGFLHDIMNSSSSSSDSSGSDSTDSDTSGMTTGKRVKRMFKNRKRRKSSASVSSGNTASVVPSAVSSPSTTERQENTWESHAASHPASRRESTLGAIASGDEADNDGPRIRDFGDANGEASESPKHKKHRRKHHKKDKKHRRRDVEKEAAETNDAAPQDVAPAPPTASTGPKVGFADNIQSIPSPTTGTVAAPPSSGRMAFNMRQLSSRTTQFRPALPKVLSNNVFVQTSPYATPAPRPAAAPRMQSSSGAASGLRRASSMPQMNREAASPPSAGPIVTRTDPLPPFQHQRRRPTTESAEAGTAAAGEEEDNPAMSRTAAIVLLLISTALVAVCAEFMVSAIPAMIGDGTGVSEAFIGLIILPIVGNAAEHVTAVTVATKNKMDLAIGVAVGSSIQIALFVTPVVVLLGWILDTDMSLYFNLFDTVSLFVTAFLVNFLILDGRSNYLEGSLLIAVYVIIALGAFFYPTEGSQSQYAGGGKE